MASYNYQPLQSPAETRLLQLEPAGHYNDKLISRLTHISLEPNPPSYEALSYVWNNSSESWTSAYNWGPPKIVYAFYPPTEGEHVPSSRDENSSSSQLGGHIICDNQKVSVGQELYDALRRLRLTDRPRLIWIDALCINQHDINERNAQVTHMREIYSKADHVLIWVGERFQGGSAIQGFLDFITQITILIQPMMYEHGPYNYKAINKDISNSWVTHFVSWSFLRELLGRAWFVCMLSSCYHMLLCTSNSSSRYLAYVEIPMLTYSM